MFEECIIVSFLVSYVIACNKRFLAIQTGFKNGESAGTSFGEHSNLLRDTCYGHQRYWIVVTRPQQQKAERFRNKTGTRKLFNRRLHTYTLASYGNSKLYSGNSWQLTLVGGNSKLYNVRASFYMLIAEYANKVRQVFQLKLV